MLDNAYSPSVYPHQIITLESKPTLAKYLSPGDQATSTTSNRRHEPGRRVASDRTYRSRGPGVV
jgi:hypothetical protein